MGNNFTDINAGKNDLQNPFPGLRPFRPDESNLFFGRENETKEVLSKLAKNRFITVIGSSGSGKSSLIYCGVIPGLTRINDNSRTEWQVFNMRPGNDPLGNMAAAFAAGQASSQNNIGEQVRKLLGSEKDGIEPVVSLLKLEQGVKLLLVIDQFEELFRYKGSRKGGMLSGDSRKFVNLIVNAVNRPDVNIHVIITMRSDYIGECAHFQGLTELINNSNYLVPHMSADNYRQAIVEPIRYAGATIEEDLVVRLVNEIGEKTDQLPVLQHALMRTWEHWKKSGITGRPVSSADYDSVGKMGEAMSRHANEAYEELDNRGKEICEVLFKTITEKGNDNRGIRHPTPVGIISDIAKCSSDELIRVIDSFRASGRSFITPPPGIELGPDSIIDISHESLMRVWDKLAVWVDEEAASVQMYQRLSEASELFQQGKTTLWRPPDLQLALNWRSDNMPTLTWAERFNPAFERAMVYLRTSEKEYLTEEENKIRYQKRQLRRSKITAMILGTAAIISVSFMLFAFIKQIEAEKSRREAEAQRLLAQNNEQLATKNAIEAENNAREAAEQRNIALANADSARRNAEVADFQRRLALTNAERASLNAEEAKRQEQEAIKNAEIATTNEQLANEQREKATRLRMISVGKSMAVKSIQVIGQGDLQVLLAYQGFLFNKRNGGAPNDVDIYMGLYNVSRIFGGANYSAFDAHAGSVKSISFIPQRESYFTSGSDGKVMEWSLDKKEEGRVIYEGDEIIEVLSVSPDGNWLACGSDKSVIKIIPLNGGLAFDLIGHNDKVKSLAFSPSDGSLFSSGPDGELLKWNLGSREYSVVSDEGEPVVAIDISKSGKYLAEAISRGIVRIWPMDTTGGSMDIESENGPVNTVRFSENDMLAIGYTNGMVKLWDITNNMLIAEMQSHTARVSDIRFNERLNQMATGSMDGLVKIYNLNDLTEPPISLDDNGGFVMALAYSPDGRVLVSGSESTTASLIARPVHVDYMVEGICGILSRNFTEMEWRRYVGADIEYEETCDMGDLRIRVQEKKGD